MCSLIRTPADVELGEPMDENLVLIVVDEVSKVVLETLMVDGTMEGVKEAALE